MKKKLKIIRIFSRLNMGGPSLHVLNLTKGLHDRGYECELILGRSEAWEGSMEKYAQEMNVEPIYIDQLKAKISFMSEVIAFIKIIKILKKEKPDIVHTHTFKAGLIGRIAARIVGVPLIVHTYHGHLLSGYWGKLKTKILKFIEKNLNKITDIVIAVSDQVANDLIRSKVVDRKKIKVIELGFDLNYLDTEMEAQATIRKKMKLNSDDILIGIVGRMVPIKNFNLFLDSLVPLLQKNPKAHLVLIGEGPERVALQEKAMQLEHKFNINSGRIHFLNWIYPFARELKDLDLYVCCSKNEGTSVAVIEAMIAKVPVVSTAVGGMPDLLKNGFWGKLCKENTLDILEACENSLANKEIYKSKLEEIAILTKNRFSLNRLVDEVDALYRQNL